MKVPDRKDPPRFIADSMLGKLARWLRILGFDTLYFRGMDDRNLTEKAVDEGRCLLTRDTRLAAAGKDGLNTLFIESDNWREQLREVLGVFQCPPAAFLSRCLICNSPLEETDREGASGLAPEYVLSTHTVFYRCPYCRKIYWSGSHLVDIRKVLTEEGLITSS
jgi:uncharacterized protein with PIN domain